jgi:hypothetical protein
LPALAPRPHHPSCLGGILRKLGWRCLITVASAGCLCFGQSAKPSNSACRVRPAAFEGWNAEELSNDWVRLILVPQLGGRLMQVIFAGHPYLFVNPKFKGKYLPPSEAKAGQWFNYGGDKLWPLPEGDSDDQWPGPIADVLDDGEYKFSLISDAPHCSVRLDGPADPKTGLQYSREISLGSDSPEIFFHAVMKNASAHQIRWSVQSVTQYDTADARDPARYNRSFWAFTPVNPQSAYIDGYRVRSGLADDPSFSVTDGLFTLHWLYLENEVWLDANAGWVAVVDDSAGYAMVERFQYQAGKEYPGKASVIFYKNGAALELDETGMPKLRTADVQQAPYYMEAELNSLMITLEPGASYAMDTQWFPARGGKGLKAVTDAGLVQRPLVATVAADGLHLSGAFAVFFSGVLKARVLDARGTQIAVVELEAVDLLNPVELNRTIRVAEGADRISLRLEDEQGIDRGSLGEAKIIRQEKIS